MIEEVKTIAAIQIWHEEDTGRYRIMLGIKEGEAAHAYVVPQEHAAAFHAALQSALSLAVEA